MVLLITNVENSFSSLLSSLLSILKKDSTSCFFLFFPTDLRIFHNFHVHLFLHSPHHNLNNPMFPDLNPLPPLNLLPHLTSQSNYSCNPSLIPSTFVAIPHFSRNFPPTVTYRHICRQSPLPPQSPHPTCSVDFRYLPSPSDPFSTFIYCPSLLPQSILRLLSSHNLPCLALSSSVVFSYLLPPFTQLRSVICPHLLIRNLPSLLR